MALLEAADLAAFATLKDFSEEQHPRDEHGKFTSGGGGESSAGPVVNGFTLHLGAVQDAASEWGGYHEAVEARYAADEILGSYSEYGYDIARPEVADAILNGPGDVEWINAEAQAAYDRAYTLLAGVHDAEPIDLPLFRGVSEEAPMMGSGLAGLRRGDTFDISLASFSGDPGIAEGYLPEGGGGITFVLEPGAKGVAVEGTETEARVNGEWTRVPGDVVMSGRMEVTSNDGTTIGIRQVGTFSPGSP